MFENFRQHGANKNCPVNLNRVALSVSFKSPLITLIIPLKTMKSNNFRYKTSQRNSTSED